MTVDYFVGASTLCRAPPDALVDGLSQLQVFIKIEGPLVLCRTASQSITFYCECQPCHGYFGQEAQV